MAPPHATAAWAQKCVPPSYGSQTTAYDGLTYQQAARAARQQGLRIDVLCTDRVADIGQPNHTGGPQRVWAAMNNGRIIFARTA
jgi:hypothetical protein